MEISDYTEYHANFLQKKKKKQLKFKFAYNCITLA